MTMRIDIGRNLAKRLHTALADRRPTRRKKWAYNTQKKLGRNHGGPTAAELRKLGKIVEEAERRRSEQAKKSARGRRPEPQSKPP